jgi:hypothetical protein
MTNQQDDGRTFFNIDQASVNEIGSGYDDDGLGTPTNLDGTGFLRIEVPVGAITDIEYTDAGIWYELGGIATVIPYRPVNATGPILVGDGIVAGTSGSGANITVTLPTAVGIPGKVITVKKVDVGTKKVILACAGAETIDGSATVELATQYDVITVVSDGAGWMTTTKTISP